MPYTQYTLAALTAEILNSLGDPAGVYWTAPEVTNAINEALHEFSGTTSYWRKRVAVSFPGYGASTWFDISKNPDVAPYRARTATIDSITKEIQAHFCEPSNGSSGAGMTSQFTITEILQSIQTAAYRFVIDAQLPLGVGLVVPSAIPPDGTVILNQNTVYVHRLSWINSDLVYFTLYRSDEFAANSLLPDWNLNPAARPLAFSQLLEAPLTVQLLPPPINSGNLELVSAATTTPADNITSLNIPDDFAHAVKYLAMVNLLTTDGETTSSLLAQYCSSRYQQIITAAKLQRSIIGVRVNNRIIPINPVATLDTTRPGWRNAPAKTIPSGCSVLYDLLIFHPSLSQDVGGTLDVAQSAPVLINPTDFIQLGSEELEAVIDYSQHYLSFKLQGEEFKQTLPLFDDFQKLVSNRNSILANQGRYLTGQFDQPAADTAFNPNTYETSAA